MNDQHDDVFTQDVLTALAAAVARAERAEEQRDEARRERNEAERVSRVLAEQYLDDLVGCLGGRQFSYMSDEEEALHHLGYTVDEWLKIDVGEPQWKAIKARWERGIRSVIDAAGRYEAAPD